MMLLICPFSSLELLISIGSFFLVKLRGALRQKDILAYPLQSNFRHASGAAHALTLFLVLCLLVIFALYFDEDFNVRLSGWLIPSRV